MYLKARGHTQSLSPRHTCTSRPEVMHSSPPRHTCTSRPEVMHSSPPRHTCTSRPEVIHRACHHVIHVPQGPRSCTARHLGCTFLYSSFLTGCRNLKNFLEIPRNS